MSKNERIMPDRGFTTSAQAARMREADAERLVEKLKRALEDYIDRHGFRPRSPVANYCTQIGMDIRISPGAGVEYAAPDAVSLAVAIEETSMPSVLKRYFET